MSDEPAVQFSVTLLVTEAGEALAGEVGVIVGTERMHSERLAREDVEVHAPVALANALRRGREYLEVASASKPDAAPPSAPKRRRTSTRQGRNDVPATEVSRSRLR